MNEWRSKGSVFAFSSNHGVCQKIKKLKKQERATGLTAGNNKDGENGCSTHSKVCGEDAASTEQHNDGGKDSVRGDFQRAAEQHVQERVLAGKEQNISKPSVYVDSEVLFLCQLGYALINNYFFFCVNDGVCTQAAMSVCAIMKLIAFNYFI